MLNLTAEDQAHTQQRCTTWAGAWMLELDGETLRQTSHDRPIEVSLSNDEYGLNGTYESNTVPFQTSGLRTSSDLSIANMDVDALLDQAGITEEQILTGQLDNVWFTMFLVNWRNPANSGVVFKRGIVGNVRTFAQQLLKGELRGLSQFLAQTTMQTYGPVCRAELGDARCQVDLAPLTLVGDIDSISVQRRIFTTGARLAMSPVEEAGWYQYGTLTMTSGANLGARVPVKTDDGTGEIELFYSLPYDLEIGDTYTLTPGCDKKRVTCRDKYNNLVNRRAEDFIPGGNRLTAGAS